MSIDHNDSDFEIDQLGDDAFDDGGDDHTQTQSGRRSRATAAGGYQLTNVLKLPRATTYSTQALYDQVHAGDINLEPEYQRDVVWPESKQIGLIDSIFRNFYVPPIIFVAHQHEDGSETKTCIDGKQRLTSIHRFMDGLIPHRDPVIGTKYWYKSNPNQSGRGLPLPDRYRRLFANKQIVCVEYQDLPDSDEREIFQRVQLGMALTPAEKLQVINSPMASFVRTLQAEYFYTGSALDAENFEWDRSRGGDFRCITQALYIISKWPSGASIAAVTQLEKWLRNPTRKPYVRSNSKKKAKETSEPSEQDLSSDAEFLDRIHGTFRTFSDLVGDASLHGLFLKPEWRVSPIEFVMMCLLVSVKKDKGTPQEVALRIGEMRVRVREEHVDIRMNARVAKTMFDFIMECDDSVGPSSGPRTRSSVKRKREDEEVVIPERNEKDRREDHTLVNAHPNDAQGDNAVPGPSSQVIPPVSSPSSTPRVPVPPRPDRLLALREAKKAIIAPPRVLSSPKPPSTPLATVNPAVVWQ